MPIFFGFLIVAVIGAIALLIVSKWAPSPEPIHDRSPTQVPTAPIAAEDLRRVRFAIGFRGYRMDQVDALLSQVEATLAANEPEPRSASELVTEPDQPEGTDVPYAGKG